MTQEALKLALEALNSCGHDGDGWDQFYDKDKVKEAITALEEVLADHAMQEVQRLGQEIEQEPVAIKRMKEWIEYLKRKSDFGQHMKIPSEMNAGTCWELALELEQFINTTPPQRKPLTNGEIYTAYITATNQTLRATDERLAFAFARAIEAAHGIKE